MTSSAVASIHEIAEDTYRISVAVPDLMPGGFSFNQYLVIDDKPLLFHTGPRKLFPLIRQQIETVLPVSKLRFIAFSHVEADECGGLADFLAAAPGSRPVCSEVAAMVSVSDLVDVEPLGMADGQALDLGRHKLVWQSTPHLPHGWAFVRKNPSAAAKSFTPVPGRSRIEFRLRSVQARSACTRPRTTWASSSAA
jgi:flavorubredoxin